MNGESKTNHPIPERKPVYPQTPDDKKGLRPPPPPPKPPDPPKKKS